MDECGGAHACTGEAQPEEDQQTPLPGILASLPTAVITLRGERAAAAVVAGANPALVEVLGRPVPSGVPLAQIAGADDLYRPDRRTPVHCTDLLIAPAIDRGETVRRVEVHLRRPDGEWRVLLASAAPLRRDGRIVGAVASLENITERRHADEQVQTRARQQAAVAALGQRALEETNSQALMVEACESLARTLAVERSQVLELLPDGETLLMRAGVGWREGLVGHAMVSASADSPAGYALRAQAPVFVEELCTDARFPGPVSLHEQDVVSGIFVAILGRDRPFGVLAAQSTRRRTFTEADVHFLQAIANVLAAAVERQRSSEELRQRFEQLRRIHHLSDAVSLASGMEAIYTEALDALQLTVGADRASVLLFDPDGAMRFKAWRGLSDTYRKAVEGHTPWQADASDPQPVLVPDVEQDPELAGLLPVFSAEGIRAVAFIPLMHLARLVGKFMLYYNAPHRFTADEVQLARTVARHVALALARTVAEDALRDSESRYRMLMEQASDAICITDIQGNIVSVNSKVVEMGGYTREELLGMNITALIPPEDLKANPLQIPQVMAGESVMHERRARRKDGSIFPVEISAKRIDGGLIQGIVRDITVRKRAENSLRFLAEASNVLYSSLDYTHTVERLARLVVPTLGDWCIMYVIEEDDTVRRAAVVHADPAKADLAARLMACPAPVIEQVRPQLEALESGRPQFLPSVPEPLLRALATGGPKHLAILHELGATAAMVVPFRGRGRLLGVAHFFLTEPGRRYDPADLALAEETARRAAVAVENASLYQEARQANEAKDQFLAVLSHELRNPLASILGGVDILRRTIPQDERSQRAIEIVDRNARLQARLVNDLLDLSRIARGMIQLQRAPIALSDVVDAAVQGARGDAEDAGLSLSADAVPGLWVHGDLDRLQQVVGNLLSNAVKFTPAGGEIRVQVQRSSANGGVGEWESGREQAQGSPVPPSPHSPIHGDVARIVVEDTGMGIPKEQIPRLFQIFQQGEVAGQRKPGLGIGLSLVKSITEKHGGRVWADSEGPGKGSRFTVELPLVPPPAGYQEDAPAAPEAQSLLLVEDNPDTRAILSESLQLEGYTVRAAESGEEALELLMEGGGGGDEKSGGVGEWESGRDGEGPVVSALSHSPTPSAWRPDAILSDIGLPGMDGYEFLRRARRLPGLESVPAFAVTGYGQDEDVTKARQCGYSGHFVKPVDVHSLAGRLRESVVSGRRRSGDKAR